MSEYTIYGILFKNTTKVYYFKSSDANINVDSCVIVDTESGLQYGKVVSKGLDSDDYSKYKDIIRVASQEDTDKYMYNLKDADEAFNKANKIIKELKLDMHVINANFSLDRTQLLISFSADDRVDFRELAKRLASVYHTRIELRQVGARDKAKQFGGVGVCGRELCCSSFLNQIDSISMNKAKNQGLALNPNKINGACGRLLCCLCYEDDVYSELRQNLLNVGTIVKYNNQDYKISSVDILKQRYKLYNGSEYIDVEASDIDGTKK